MNKKILKNDKYRKSREGRSRLLNILCAKCGTEILEYQKDGTGARKAFRVFQEAVIKKIKKMN